MQWEDGGPWTHDMILEGNSTDHNRQSYIVRVTKIGRLIMYNTRDIHMTPTMAV